MCKLYTQLPDIYRTYIKDNILEIVHKTEKYYTRIGSLDTHSVIRVPKHLILTEEGIRRFPDYWPIIDIFRLAPNCSSLVHIDNSYHAFNFIITCNGYMEWFDLNKLEFDYTTKAGQKIYKFLEEAVIEKTECSMMWVNTKVPHRIVNNSNSERWCVSIRTLADIPFTI
jgi:uncharacterized RmlC-like cupin family protein